MNRRQFLSVISGAMGASLAGANALANPRSGSRNAVGPVGPGVAAAAIRVGMSAAFRGSAAGLGTEFYRGAQAWYAEVNARGGINGRAIQVIALDDGYEPVPCITNTIELLDKHDVFFLSNYVGTPTLTRALPLLRRYADRDVLLVGNFTGAQPQREPPYVDQVFNIRASYRQEMMALVDRFWQLGARKFGVFYQIDAYGRSGTDGVARGLALRGAHISGEATYTRGATFDADMRPAVRALQQAGADVVLCTGAYQGCGAFVRAARDLGWGVPISNLSFVGSDSMLHLLLEHSRRTGRDYTRALVNSQVVPSYEDTTLTAVTEYRTLMERHDPRPPEALRDSHYALQNLSFVGLEGFVNAKVITEALRRTGPAPTRPDFRAALESLRGLDVGIGAPVTFGPGRHQGLDAVYFTRVERNGWASITNWSEAIKA